MTPPTPPEAERRVSLRGNVWRHSDFGSGPCWWYAQSKWVKTIAESVDLSAALDRIAHLEAHCEILLGRNNELRLTLSATLDDEETLRARLEIAERERDEAHGVIGEVAFQGKADGLVLLHVTAKDPFWQRVAKIELDRRLRPASTSTDREVKE